MVSKIAVFFNSKAFSFFAVILIAVILFTQADHYYGYTGNEKAGQNCVVSDGTGYFAYLPQYIVFPDSTNFSYTKHIHDKYPDMKFFSMLSYDDAQKRVYTKFYVGTALLQAPFYFIAHKIHQWSGWEADGHSRGYRLSLHLAAIFYWLVGVISLFQFFNRKGFTRFSMLCGIALITFGTNLNFFTSYWVSMSHVYSFSMIAAFINLSALWAENDKRKHFFWMLFVLGLIAIIRPVNVLVVFIVPFLFDSWRVFFNRIKNLFVRNYVQALIGFILCFIPVAVHLAIQYHQSGSFSLYTYKNEGFTNASNPQFWNVLFSYQKGFFVYAPAMFVLFIGIVYFIKKERRFLILGWFLTVLIWLYAISSWWCWDYGGSLGMRAMIELLPLFLLPIMFIFHAKSKVVLLVSVAVMLLGAAFYQRLQTQFNSGIIDCCEMTKADYWNVFLKTDERHRWMVAYDRSRETLDEKKRDVEFEANFAIDKWQIQRNPDTTKLVTLVYDKIPMLIYRVDTKAVKLQGRISGDIKLMDPKCNPFVSIRYIDEPNLVEESVFTIGSRIEDEYAFEHFDIAINHELTNKNIDRVEFVISLGGCVPEFKNVNFVKFK